MNPMEYNPASGIYEQFNEFPGSNIGGNRSNEGIGNTGGNNAFTPGYQGFNSPEYKGVNFAAVRRAEIAAEREKGIKKADGYEMLLRSERERYLQFSGKRHTK